MRRTIKTEIDREPENHFHEITNLPDFVEVIPNGEEFSVFADETIKTNDVIDECNEQESPKLEDSTNNGPLTDEESNGGEYGDDCDKDYDEDDVDEEAVETASNNCDFEIKEESGKFHGLF